MKSIIDETLNPTPKNCSTCLYHVKGACHANPPQVVLYPTDNQHPVLYTPITCFPDTAPDDRCGRWSHRPLRRENLKKLVANPETPR